MSRVSLVYPVSVAGDPLAKITEIERVMAKIDDGVICNGAGARRCE